MPTNVEGVSLFRIRESTDYKSIVARCDTILRMTQDNPKKFSKNFLWGAATAAYQVEGGNTNADWWHWEKRAGREQSADACGHYDLYEIDFELAKNLSHNAHRISIEWSRVEPEEGRFSADAIEHYRKVLIALKLRGMEPVVTLHHFTNPEWIARRGGWTKPKTVKYFLRFAARVVSDLSDLVHYWITINEPTIYFTHSFILGVWPPQEKSILKGLIVQRNLAKAHKKTYKKIHKIYRKKSLSRPAVSFSQHMQAFVPCDKSLKNRFAAWLRHRWFNLGMIKQAIRSGTLDFVGVNYYSRQRVDLKGCGLGNFATDVCEKDHNPRKKNDLGWDIYPEGLEMLLNDVKKLGFPIMVTENGICAGDDNLRWEFIEGHLSALHNAMENGANVIGYLYWSLLDNFEWAEGFKPRFGLVEVNYETGQRTVRESAKKYREVCSRGILK